MTPFELLAAAYFAGLAAAAPAAGVPRQQRTLAIGLALVLAAGVASTSTFGSDAARAWAPHVYLVAGYWVPGLLARRLAGVTKFEEWLAGTERAVRPRLPSVPAPFEHLLELAYLLCYPVVPASFLVVWSRGGADDVSRFWLAILFAGYGCYVTLPWLVSRPPRLTVAAAPAGPLAMVNVYVLRRVSHELNTFPSGHVAVSWAAAASVWPVSPAAALVLGAIAVAVAIGAAAGRYHYVIDVWLGILVAAVAITISHAVV